MIESRGRHSTEDEPRLYREAAALVEAMRRAPSGLAAEWALSAVRPLRAAFRDHEPAPDEGPLERARLQALAARFEEGERQRRRR